MSAARPPEGAQIRSAQREGTPVSAFAAAAPTPGERLFSECCRQLYASVANRELHERAWSCIAPLFGATGVSLLRNVAGLGELQADAVTVAFDCRVAHPVLAQVLAEGGVEHGICAFVARRASGADVLLVLRKSTPFTPCEHGWLDLLTVHVRTATELAQQHLAAPAPAEAQPAIVPACEPLTKAELEVLGSLLRGQTAKEIARSRGASLNTVRSQITSILGKTGRHTQKELIAAFGNI
jgi:DNA-binding CsgD family transcriptional regulator